MTLAETREKCKALIAQIPRDGLIVVVLVLTSSASFGLGYLTGVDSGQGSEPSTRDSISVQPEITEETGGKYLSSKNGTKYYLPSCAGANKIAEANKIWFTSVAAAEAAGYSPAANCTFPLPTSPVR